MPKELILRKSAKITTAFKARFFPFIKAPKCAMVYLSTQSEVKTAAIINHLADNGTGIFVPCLDNGVITPVKYTRGCRLSKGAFKIKEPVKKIKPKTPKCIEMVVVPGIAFDPRGNRVGFGKGFFDRFLKKLGPSSIKVALAFEKQIVKAVPSQPHDVRMNYIITEDRIINCGNNK